MSNKTLNLTDELYDYFMSVSTRESALLKKLRVETASDPLARMQIAPEQGQFMMLLTELVGATKAIEIGVFTGYSALCFALALPADGKLIACDINAEWTSMAQRYWQEAGVQDKIDLRLAPAMDTLDSLLEDGQAGTFDIVFIDADKAAYDGYYERSLKLLRRGGLILLDNMLRAGRVLDENDISADTQGIRDLNEKLHHDERITLSFLPLADGLTLALKR